MFIPPRLKDSISPSGARDPDSVIAAKQGLIAVGEYKPDQGEITGFPDSGMMAAIRRYQQKQGLFPDAVSDRGRKHLRELAAIRDETTRAVMFFCVLHEGIDRVSAAGQIDSRYRDTLLEVMEQGVEVLAWRANVTPEGIIMNRPLPFSVDPNE